MFSRLLIIPILVCLTGTGCYQAVQERPQAVPASPQLDSREHYLQAQADAQTLRKQLVASQWDLALENGRSMVRHLDAILDDPSLDPKLKALVRLLPPTAEMTVTLIERQDMKAVRVATQLLSQFDQVTYNLVDRGWIPPQQGGGGGSLPIVHD